MDFTNGEALGTSIEATEALDNGSFADADSFRPESRVREVHALRAEAVRLAGARSTPSSVISDWCQRAHDCLKGLAENHPDQIVTWQELLLPFFLKSPFLHRCREKPRGYAGDYLTIQMMYEAAPNGADHFGRAVEAWAMSQPCPRAVRNRRRLVRDFVQKVCREASGEAPSVVSLGSGPAAEAFDLVHLPQVRFTLIDIDQDAIDFVRAKARANGVENRITPLRANIIKMALRDECRLPAGQAAFYSLGVIDYFNDELVVRLLNYIHGKLARGGRAFLGNFRPDHANVALFRHALDWPLTLRSKSDLYRLVQQSRFARCPVAVGAEGEGVQLFMECRKVD